MCPENSCVSLLLSLPSSHSVLRDRCCSALFHSLFFPASCIVLVFQVYTKSDGFPGCQKWNQSCFLSAFVAQPHSSSWRRPNLAQCILILVCCWQFVFLGWVVGLTQTSKDLQERWFGLRLSFLDCFPSLDIKHSPAIWLFISVFSFTNLCHMWLWPQGTGGMESGFSFSEIAGARSLAFAPSPISIRGSTGLVTNYTSRLGVRLSCQKLSEAQAMRALCRQWERIAIAPLPPAITTSGVHGL